MLLRIRGSCPSHCKFRKAVTIDYAPVMRANDPPAKLWLSLNVDSGFIIALQGPDSFAVIRWESKTQRAASRSTTEAEFADLSTALFGDAISLLAVCQRVIASTTFVLKAYEDNQAVLTIIAKHLAKFHRINVASTCEAFSAGGNPHRLHQNKPSKGRCHG